MEAAVEAELELGALAFLFNCSQAEIVRAAVLEARDVRDRKDASVELDVYANAFEPERESMAANDGLSTLRADLFVSSADCAHRQVRAARVRNGAAVPYPPRGFFELIGSRNRELNKRFRFSRLDRDPLWADHGRHKLGLADGARGLRVKR